MTEPEVYTIGELTLERVFRASGITNLSDLQAVMDAVEAALQRAVAPEVRAAEEALRMSLEAVDWAYSAGTEMDESGSARTHDEYLKKVRSFEVQARVALAKLRGSAG